MKIKDFNALSVRSLQCVGGETSQLYACVWQHVGIPNLPFALELLDCRHSGFIVFSAIWIWNASFVQYRQYRHCGAGTSFEWSLQDFLAKTCYLQCSFQILNGCYRSCC